MTDTRRLPFPLRQAASSSAIVGTANHHKNTPVWVTNDPDEVVSVQMDLSLNEYVALATALDVGRDIAYADESDYIWWLWTRAFVQTLEVDLPSCVPTLGGGGYMQLLPDCISIQDNIINICTGGCPDMVINIYQCGCGGNGCANCSGGQSSLGGGQSSGGGASGSWTNEPPALQAYSGIVSGCDVVTGGLLDFIIQDQADMLTGLGNAGGSLTSILQFFAGLSPTAIVTNDGVDWLRDQALEGFENGADYWITNEFHVLAKTAWVKTFGDRQWSQITRQNLFAWAANLPTIVFVGTYPVAVRSMAQGLIRFENMAIINQHIATSAGDCDANDYEYYFANAGIPYAPATDVATLPLPAPEAWAYDWAQLFDFTVDEQDWLVSVNYGTYSAGVGWSSNKGSNALDYYMEIHLPVSATFTGVRLYLDEVMAGDTDLMQFATAAGGSGIIISETPTGEAVIDRALEAVVSGQLYLYMSEWAYANNSSDDFTQHVTRIELYGTGSRPAVGQDLY